MDSKVDNTSLAGPDKLESVSDTNGVNSASIKDADSNLKSVVSSDDETEGFASGEEEAFETVLDKNLETLEGEDNDETFSEPLGFPLPKADDAGEADDGEKVKVGFGEDLEAVKDEEVVVANGVKSTVEGDSIVEEIKVETPAPGVAVVVPNTEEVEDDDEDEDVLLVGGSDEGDSAAANKTDEETPDLESVDAKSVNLTTERESYASVVAKTVEEKPVIESVDEKDVNVTTERESYASVVAKTVEEKPVIEPVDEKEVKVSNEGDADVAVVTKTDEEKPVIEPVDEKEVKVSDEGDADVAVVTKTDEEKPVIESVDEKDVKVFNEGDADVAVVAKTDEEKPVIKSVDEKEVKVSNEGDADVAVVAKTVEEKPVLESVNAEDVAVVDSDSVVDADVDVDLPLPGVADVAVVVKTEEDGADVAESDEIGSVFEEVVDKEVVGEIDNKFAPLDVEEVKTALNDVEDVEEKSTEELTKDMPENADNGLEESDGSHSDESSEAAKRFMEELGGGGGGGGSNTGGESSLDRSQIDGQIVTDSDEEDDEEEDGKELFDSAALAALLKAAADGGSEGGNITFSSEDGSRLFTVERPAGLGSSLQAMRAAPRPPRANIFNPASLTSSGETEPELTEEERSKLEKLQSIRVKFLRLVERLGLSPDENVASQVLYRLALIAGRQTGQSFSLDAAKRKASELESAGDTNLDFSVNVLVIGKAGVGKSATINSIFGEEKTPVGAFQTATGSVKEITGVVGGVMVRVFDTPGLRSSVMEQGYNRNILSSAKQLSKKNPFDIVLYVDRLDAQTRDHNDIPLLKTVTGSLGSATWRNAIVTFTHGASAPPEGANGNPLSYETFVTQRSHVVQQAIGQAVGDLRMMSPGLMNPVSLVENHQSCRKNRDGQKVLPNGQTWRPQLLMLCYSMKILSEANSLTKPQDPFDSRKLFGFRVRSPPLPYMLSSMLQSRPHPKLSADQGGDGGDSDVDLTELTDSDREDEEDEYDQLPPFKPLKRSQLAKLSNEQKKAYFDEYDYRVKLLQKKQWKEEVKRVKEMKRKGLTGQSLTGQTEEEGDGDAPAPVAVPLPDMALPPSFDSDNPAYRFRFLEPTSQFLARPVLDTHGWDHDCGYDGVNVEQTLAVANRFPAAVSVQVTKDKKDFSINMDSSISAKLNENVSTMAGFDVQPIGKQLAYIVRGETKFKNLKKNKTAAGVSVTFLGENVVTGFKVEDQIAFGRQYAIIGSAGTVRFQTDSAYGANVEVQRRELDYPIGQIQSTIGLSIIKWRGDLALGLNSLAQFSAGRNSKVTVRAGINNKMSGQITVKTSSSEYLSLALAAVIPAVISAYKKVRAGGGDGDKYSPY